MRLADTLYLALRNLREARLRTALTSLGVAIGIASLVGMVSFGVAMQDQVLGNLLRSGVFDSITVTAAQRAGGQRGRRGGSPAARAHAGSARQAGRVPLDDAALKTFAAIPGVRGSTGCPHPGRGFVSEFSSSPARSASRCRRADRASSSASASAEFFRTTPTTRACSAWSSPDA
jgi:hypothetical protein